MIAGRTRSGPTCSLARLDPLMGMMLGKLKVTGDMGQISRHVAAAKEMVACAASVETTPSDG